MIVVVLATSARPFPKCRSPHSFVPRMPKATQLKLPGINLVIPWIASRRGPNPANLGRHRHSWNKSGSEGQGGHGLPEGLDLEVIEVDLGGGHLRVAQKLADGEEAGPGP